LDYRDVQKDGEGVAVKGLRRFSLDDILGCGQCFRWDMQEPGRWRGTAFGLARELVQKGDGLKIIGADISEFQNVWHGYFDFGRDYGELSERLSQDPAMRRAVEFSPGMRVLRQEPWEALCSFIVSQNNNIKRIKGIVARLCELFGKEIEGGRAFPAPERLAALDEKALEPLRCGFRAGYLLDAARKVSSGEIDFGRINGLGAEEAALELQKIRGVGPKVAACALLYGFARADTIPVDVWIKRALAEFYPNGMPPELKEIQGLGQQYLFHYMRNR
jgi:N-glycosylase/DNA lyase